MLWADGLTVEAPEVSDETFIFAEKDIELAPTGTVDLVVIGCPQASVGEARATAAAVRSHMELGQKIQDSRLWVFTSGLQLRIGRKPMEL